MSEGQRDDPSEREKWEAEQHRLDQELRLKERELTFKEREAHRSRWWNPLVIAIMAATIAAVSNTGVSFQNNRATLELENFKAESARIFEIIKTGDPKKAADNLRFLMDTGLIQNITTAESIRNYLKELKPGEGVVLPAGRRYDTSWGSGSYDYSWDTGRSDMGFDFSPPNLRGIDLTGRQLIGMDLRYADLRNANLRNADLTGADLRNTDLNDANLTGADLTNAKLSRAILSGAIGLTQVQLDQACGIGVKLDPGLSIKPCPAGGMR